MRASSQSSTQIYRQAPCAALRPIIQHFLVIEFPSVHRDAHLPETDAVAAFSFRGACRIDETGLAPPVAFTGPRDVLRMHEHLDGHAVLLATFTPVGAYTFLRAPLEEFTGYTVSLTDLIGSPGEELSLSDRLNSAKNHRQRIALVEQFLLAKKRGLTPDPLISAGVAWLERSAEAKRIDDLSRYVGLS